VALLIEDVSVIAREAIEQAAAEAARDAVLEMIEREAAALRDAERWRMETETAKARGKKNMVIGIVAGLLGGLAIGITGTVIVTR
jgi:hypothetical protein